MNMFGNNVNKVQRAIEKGNEKALLQLAESKNKDVRLAAIKGLGSVPADDSNNYLITILRAEDADLRTAAAEALGNQGISRAHEFLSHQLKNEKDLRVAETLTNAMHKLSPLKE